MQPVLRETVTSENIQIAWNEFAETRRTQVGEYEILKRAIRFEHPVVHITLINSFEDPLVNNFKVDVTRFLRGRCKNSDLTITTSVQEITGKKMIHTAREKFEHLAEKNPKLWDLKDRLGLDWDI